MNRKILLTASCILTALGTTGLAAAQNPFVGTWKLDQAKSRLAGDTMKFGPAAGGSMQILTGGTSYSFRVDGNDYRMASGNLARWKQVDGNTWTTDYMKPNGKLLTTDTWKLAPDGKSLAVVSSGTRPDGKSFSDEVTYVRTAGATGLLGAWKSTQVQLSSPNEISIQEYGLDGLILTVNAMKATCLIIFGGRDAVPTGPNIPHGLTLSLTRTGPAAFRLIRKMNGSPIYTAQYTVSKDGETMTEVGNSPGDPAQTLVWVKQ